MQEIIPHVSFGKGKITIESISHSDSLDSI